MLKLIEKIYLGLLLKKREAIHNKIAKFSNEYHNLETFHYFISMDPIEYELKRQDYEKKIFSYNYKSQNLNNKIHCLFRKLK